MTSQARYALAKPDPQVLVIFGASGDLTTRKLLPALASLAARDALPEHFSVVGVALSELDDNGFRDLGRAAVPDAPPSWATLTDSFRYICGHYEDATTFATLKKVLEDIDRTCSTQGNRLYYLATIPSLFPILTQALKQAGLSNPPGSGPFTRIVVEKPFGSDLDSAIDLNVMLHECFDEHQIFRIDHYLGKETVQNLLALRFANAIFEPIWNRRYISNAQITVAEQLGVEHRGAYYDKAGAVRDMVQNHLAQVVALTLMEPPAAIDPLGVRDEKVKLLRAVELGPPHELSQRTVRAQYDAGVIGTAAVPGYLEEEGIAPASETETFAAAQLHVDNWRWAGVPVYIRTGKRLAQTVTEVVLEFREVPHMAFKAHQARRLEPNHLVMRIQPHEGINLAFGAKEPGESFNLRSVDMHFSYADTFGVAPADAYERLIHDALLGDHMLFLRADEAEQAWRIIDPYLDAFAQGDPPLSTYPAGSWGPHEADILLARNGHEWHNPAP